jgi:type I restriction enzyme S subunit
VTFLTAPLWSLALHNQETLTEFTEPEFEFDYIDIGNVSRDSGIEDSERVFFETAPSRARRVLRAGDFMVSTVRTYLRAVARVPPEHDGSVASTGFAVLRARPRADRRFLAHVIVDPAFVETIVAHSIGVSYPAITTSRLLRLRVPAPEQRQQIEIANFLDRESDRTRSVVRAAGDVIASLTRSERVIADAVVHGLPCLPLKAVATIHSGVTLNEAKAPADAVRVPYLRVANVKAGWLDLDEVKEVPISPGDIPHYALKPGDLLLTEGGDLDKLGRGALWAGDISPCLFQNHVFAVRPRHDAAVPAFLSWATRSSAARSYFEATASRITNIASTNRSKLGRWPVPDAPIEEQRRRVAVAESAWQRAQRAITTARDLSNALTAYRDSLIHEAVTGKLDVTKLSDRQMDERLHAAAEGRLDEVPV